SMPRLLDGKYGPVPSDFGDKATKSGPGFRPQARKVCQRKTASAAKCARARRGFMPTRHVGCTLARLRTEADMEKTNVSDKSAGNGSRLTREHLEETIEAAREKVAELGRTISRFVRERPAAALLMAVGAGYLVARLLRR